MRITFVNVGYGDAILMESDTGLYGALRWRRQSAAREI